MIRGKEKKEPKKARDLTEGSPFFGLLAFALPVIRLVYGQCAL